MSDKLKEVCAYVRVSTDKQEELSPDSQIRLIKEYAQTHGMLLTHIYKEEHGISGKDADKRPAFQEMIATCKEKSHPYDAILLWKFSRFARNIDESTYYKSILRKKCNVDVISISEPIIEGMYGRLIEMVIEWSDEFYLYNLSGEVKRGMTQKAMNGGYNANAPIGYSKEKGEIPVVNPEEALIVRKIFDMAANQKMSRAEIASTLNRQNIPTRRGNKWETRTITYILENPFYIGKIRWNYFDRNRQQRKNADEVILADGQHEPIISEEMFLEAGKVIASDRAVKKTYGVKRNAVATKHWLSGILKCSGCGGNLAYNKGYEENRSPACFRCWKNAKGMCETSNYISASKAEQHIYDVLQSLIESGQEYVYHPTAPIVEQDDDVRLIEKELASLKKKERRIKDAYMNGIDTLDEYKENKVLLNTKRTELQKQLTMLQNNTVKATTTYYPIDFQKTLELLQDPNIDNAEKTNAVRKVFESIIWDSKKKDFEVFTSENLKVEKP